MKKINRVTLGTKKMKTLFFVLPLIFVCSPSIAILVVTNPISDIKAQVQYYARYAQAADNNARQALQYQNDILRYEAMLKNLQNNPLGVVVPNLGLLVTNAAKIMSNGKSIGENMSSVSGNIEKAFKNPSGDFGVKFKIWTNASTDALTSSMLNAGLHRENFANDTAALQALIEKNNASGGALAATKTLGEINTAQLMESIKLRELISSQQLAVNTYMMSQANKEQAKQDASTVQFAPYIPEERNYKTPKFQTK